MKNTTMALAFAAALILAKRRAAQQTPQGARVGQLSEQAIVDGSNWTSDWWGRLSGTDLRDHAAPNLTASGNADPGRVGQAQMGLAPGWDGSL